MSIRIDEDGNHQTALTINAWLAAHGPAWRDRVRAQYGDSADDCLEMILGDVG